MSELIRQIALVSQSNLIARADVSKVAAAIQKQATRDLAPIWSVSTTVNAFDALDDVPIGYWALVVMDNIDTPGASGIHEDNNGQPFALISASADLDVWSLTASHEALEILVDPFGRRMVAGVAPTDSGQDRVSHLVEVCDPCESAAFACSSNGIRVSDFYTPAFFDPVAANGIQYSFTGALKGPRQVAGRLIPDEGELVDVHQAHVGDLEMRDHRQRQEGDLQEGLGQRHAQTLGGGAQRDQRLAHRLEAC
jgi:hypothetical protein